jgi:hypothetical protein
MPYPLIRACLAMALAVGAADAALAETYRCRQADGRVSFQGLPCELPDLAPQAEAAAAPAATAAASRSLDDLPKPTRRKREVLELTLLLERCRDADPAFAEASAPVYAAWRQRHAGTLAEYDRLLAVQLRSARRSSAPPPDCSEAWLAQIAPLARTPDPRFSTAEKTWAVFIEALRAADRETALSCLAGAAEDEWKQRVERLSDEDLRRIARAIRAMRIQWGDDYEKEGVVAGDDRSGPIAFRNRNEEWKISDL